jgi:endonuclease YncB( thermonuclease family)
LVSLLAPPCCRRPRRWQILYWPRLSDRRRHDRDSRRTHPHPRYRRAGERAVLLQEDRESRRGAWPCGQQAALALSDWVGEQTVTCETTNKDMYKRWLARCAVAGQDVAEWVAPNGWAVPYRDCKCDVIRDAVHRARAAQLGIWSSALPSSTTAISPSLRRSVQPT